MKADIVLRLRLCEDVIPLQSSEASSIINIFRKYSQVSVAVAVQLKNT